MLIKRTIVVALTIFLPLINTAQEAIRGKVISLHPNIGEVITLDEKIKYQLLPDYPDSLFLNAMLVVQENNIYSFIIKTTRGKDKSFYKATNMQEINAIKVNIAAIQQTPLDEMMARINSNSPCGNSSIINEKIITKNKEKLNKKDVDNFSDKMSNTIASLDKLIVEIFKFVASMNGHSFS